MLDTHEQCSPNTLACGIMLGSCWHHVKIILGSVWGHVGIMLESFWDRLGITLIPCRDHVGTMSGSCWTDVEIMWGSRHSPLDNAGTKLASHCFGGGCDCGIDGCGCGDAAMRCHIALFPSILGDDLAIHRIRKRAARGGAHLATMALQSSGVGP